MLHYSTMKKFALGYYCCCCCWCYCLLSSLQSILFSASSYEFHVRVVVYIASVTLFWYYYYVRFYNNGKQTIVTSHKHTHTYNLPSYDSAYENFQLFFSIGAEWYGFRKSSAILILFFFFENRAVNFSDFLSDCVQLCEKQCENNFQFSICGPFREIEASLISDGCANPMYSV